MAKLIRYRRDRPNDFTPHSDGSLPMSAFVKSAQARHPALQAAGDVIRIAKGLAPKGSGNYAGSFGIGPAKEFWFKPHGEPLQLRAVAEVTNSAESAPAIEWGSGLSNDGASPETTRPQGGSNKPFRVLGRAGARVGDYHE
jgi:hypothetical protein